MARTFDSEGLSLSFKRVEDEPFPFMKLPPELRNMICETLLVKPDPINCSQRRTQYVRGPGNQVYSYRLPPDEAYHLYLLRVSREFHKQCGLLFYTGNTFKADGSPALLKWIEHDLSTAHRRAIARLIVYWNGVSPKKAMKAVGTCVGLRHLDLRFRYVRPSGNRLDWMHIQGLDQLLKLRNIQGLKVSNTEGYPAVNARFQGWDRLLQALQTVKQLRSKSSLTRQDKKDFPEGQGAGANGTGVAVA